MDVKESNNKQKASELQFHEHFPSLKSNKFHNEESKGSRTPTRTWTLQIPRHFRVLFQEILSDMNLINASTKIFSEMIHQHREKHRIIKEISSVKSKDLSVGKRIYESLPEMQF